MANEAQLNIRVTATNDAEGVLKQLAEVMDKLGTSIREASQMAQQAFESMSKSAITEGNSAAQAATNTANETEKQFNSMASVINANRLKIGQDVDAIRQDFINLDNVKLTESKAEVKALASAVKSAKSPVSSLKKEFDTSFDGIGKATKNAADTVTKNLTEMKKGFDPLESAAQSADKSVSTYMKNMAESVQAQKASIIGDLESISDKFDEVARARRNQNGGDSVDSYVKSDALMDVGQQFQQWGETGMGAFTSMVGDAADFEKSLSGISAALYATGTPLDQANVTVGQLKEKALDLGSHYHRSANEIADAMDAMIRQGVSAQAVLDGAAASAIKVSLVTKQDLGSTATVISDIFNEFRGDFETNGKSMEQNMNDVGNSMTAAMLQARISMDDYLNTMKYVGPQASALGVPLNDVSAAIATLAEHGIKGSSAGTALRRMFTNIVQPTEDGTTALKELGLVQGDHNKLIDEATGKMKPLVEVQRLLHDSMENLTPVQQQAYTKMIFGQYALSGMTAFVKSSSDEFKGLTEQMQNVSAEQAAQIAIDNLSGDVMLLEANMGTLRKTMGDTLETAMRSLVQTVDKIVVAFTGLPEPVQKTIMVILGVGSGLLVATGAIMTFAATIGFLSMGLGQLGLTFASFLVPFTSFGSMIGGIGATVATLGTRLGGVAGAFRGIGTAISVLTKAPFQMLTSFVMFMRGIPDIVMRIPQAFTFLGEAFVSLRLQGALALTVIRTAFSNFGTYLFTLGPRIIAAVTSAFSWTSIVAVARVAMSTLFGPWGLLIAAIVAGVGLIITNWDSIKAWVQEHFGGTMVGDFTKFKETFTQIWNAIRDDFKAAWDFMKENLKAAWDYIHPTLEGAVTKVKTFWTENWDSIKQVFDFVWKACIVILTPALATITTAITFGIGFIAGAWSDTWNLIKDTFKTVWDLVVDIIRLNWDMVSGVITIGLDLLTGKWGKAWEDIKKLFSNVWDDIITLIKNLSGNVFNMGLDFVKGLANGITSGISYVISAAKSVVSSITSIFSSAPKAPNVGGSSVNIPAFAEGGKVDRPTLALVGEGGESEYIIPESKLKGGGLFGDLHTGTSPLPDTIPLGNGFSSSRGGGGVSITKLEINVNGVGKDGRSIGSDIADQLRQQFHFAL
ncbi:phage tail tape measure protein [Paenibacillus hexagrammi]|uniref:Phage tail tape measure protein n=1 Tax=Paenibacillus hexagrammi TaxID=2908839 RepID=A0ABY3ST86_9BACL|nr:phage tail tape measure protein [Paenibacillus sp. YPD9-1]UJF36628.1 phage tail tape measure protein [Paenibacillus sp. YPD9-1]